MFFHIDRFYNTADRRLQRIHIQLIFRTLNGHLCTLNPHLGRIDPGRRRFQPHGCRLLIRIHYFLCVAVNLLFCDILDRLGLFQTLIRIGQCAVKLLPAVVNGLDPGFQLIVG